MSFSINIQYTEETIKEKILPWLYFYNEKTMKREVLPEDEITLMTNTNLEEWFYAIDKLNKFRDYILKRLKIDIREHINSSFRCSKRNIEVGGTLNSLHLTKWAIDIQDSQGLITNLVKNQPTYDDKAFLKECGLYFIGEYKYAKIIHIQGQPFKTVENIYISSN